MTGAAQPMPRAVAAALLGVPEDVPAADLQRAFLRAVRRVHPDLLGDVGQVERRAAAEAFVRLSHARDVLLEPPPPRRTTGDAIPVHPTDPRGGPVFTRVEGRGLGGSLVVLALLAFLLVAIVSFEQAVSGGALGPAPAPTTADTGGR